MSTFELYDLLKRVSFDGKTIDDKSRIDEVYLEDELRGLVAHCDGFVMGINPNGDIIVCIDD